MKEETKLEIGKRLKAKRELAGYTRERLAERCGLSPRFIANIEFGDSSLSVDSLMAICRVLPCSADALLFGDSIDPKAWAGTVAKLEALDVKYQPGVDKVIQGMIEAISATE